MVCYFRIGNKKYQELYGSFGVTNILKKHVSFKQDDDGKPYMFIEYIGKKGVLNSCLIYDKDLIREIKEMLKFREDDEIIFQWNDHGMKIPIKAIDVNIWLNNFDKRITSKDFRTYDSNILLIIFLREKKHTPDKYIIAERKKIVISALLNVSKKLHNTPAVLKKNYTQSGIIDMYIHEPTRFIRYFMQENTARNALSTYLKDYCRTLTE
jgi:DNA topoisomerase IB